MTMRKNILFTILASVLCLTLLVPVSAAGDAPQQASLTDGLVIAYDFEGDTDDIRLQDKAPHGSVKDDLTVSGSVFLRDGVAICGGTQNADYLFAPKGTADLTSLKEYTVYTKVNLDFLGDESGTPEFLSIPGISSFNITAIDPSTATYSMRTRSYIGVWQNCSTITGEGTQPKLTEQGYLYIAFSAKFDSATGKVAMDSYYSTDGSNYFAFNNSHDAGTSFPGWKTTGGNYSLHLGQYTQGKVQASFDDFFVFNRALSANEVAQLSTVTLASLPDASVTDAPGSNATPQPSTPAVTAKPSTPTQTPTKTAEVPTENSNATQTPTDNAPAAVEAGCTSVLPAAALGSILVMSFGCAIICKQKGERK